MKPQPITKFINPEFAIYIYGDGTIELHNHSAGSLTFSNRDELLRMVEFIAQQDLSRSLPLNNKLRVCEYALEICRFDRKAYRERVQELGDELSRLWGESAPHKSGEECLSCKRLATEGEICTLGYPVLSTQKTAPIYGKKRRKTEFHPTYRGIENCNEGFSLQKTPPIWDKLGI